MYLTDLSADFAEDLASPAFAVSDAFACTGHSWASVTAYGESELGGLGFAEAVQHGLRFFFITGLYEFELAGRYALLEKLSFTMMEVKVKIRFAYIRLTLHMTGFVSPPSLSTVN